MLLEFNLTKLESLMRVKWRDHKKLEDATCDVCKTVKQKPKQVKLKVGGGRDWWSCDDSIWT